MRPTPDAMLGFQPEGKVTIDVRHWDALRRIVWRMKTSWGFVENECNAIIATCRHVDGCRGAVDSTETCHPQCPDRQTRLSALVILANAREFARADVHKPGANYIPPTREYFDALVSDLATAEYTLEEVRRKVADAVEPTLPAPTTNGSEAPLALTDGSHITNEPAEETA
jgi:hypothetical protein